MSNYTPKPIKIKGISEDWKLNAVCKEFQKQSDDPFKLTVLYAHFHEDIQIQTCPVTRLSHNPMRAMTDLIFLEHVASLPVTDNSTKILYDWAIPKRPRTARSSNFRCRLLDVVDAVLDAVQCSVQEAIKIAKNHGIIRKVTYTHCEELSDRIIQGIGELREKLRERLGDCYQTGKCKPRIVHKTSEKHPNVELEASVEEIEAEGSSKVEARAEPETENKTMK
jgi:hypothetical protein